ncbi:winged helix-turn-helix transcriptional regulator [Candidatus Saccharibacteria bacterium]|nr:winged helix-turn-helix transcriptional regulator [Candidatus Saccharibacteria bacterium]
MKEHMTDEQLLSLLRGFFVFGDASVLKILYELERYGEKNFSELRDQLDINPATLSKKLRLLVEVGLVASDRTHDHLRVYYSINNHRRPLRRVLDAIERLANEL